MKVANLQALAVVLFVLSAVSVVDSRPKPGHEATGDFSHPQRKQQGTGPATKPGGYVPPEWHNGNCQPNASCKFDNDACTFETNPYDYELKWERQEERHGHDKCNGYMELNATGEEKNDEGIMASPPQDAATGDYQCCLWFRYSISHDHDSSGPLELSVLLRGNGKAKQRYEKHVWSSKQSTSGFFQQVNEVCMTCPGEKYRVYFKGKLLKRRSPRNTLKIRVDDICYRVVASSTTTTTPSTTVSSTSPSSLSSSLTTITTSTSSSTTTATAAAASTTETTTTEPTSSTTTTGSPATTVAGSSNEDTNLDTNVLIAIIVPLVVVFVIGIIVVVFLCCRRRKRNRQKCLAQTALSSVCTLSASSTAPIVPESAENAGFIGDQNIPADSHDGTNASRPTDDDVEDDYNRLNLRGTPAPTTTTTNGNNAVATTNTNTTSDNYDHMPTQQGIPIPTQRRKDPQVHNSSVANSSGYETIDDVKGVTASHLSPGVKPGSTYEEIDGFRNDATSKSACGGDGYGDDYDRLGVLSGKGDAGARGGSGPVNHYDHFNGPAGTDADYSGLHVMDNRRDQQRNLAALDYSHVAI